MITRKTAFTLIEMMVVITIIGVMVAVAGLAFSRSRPSVKVKKDAAQTLSFLRNMWDRTKATGAPLILSPDFETGTLSYVSPRSGMEEKADFSSKSMVIGIMLNDRFYSRATHQGLPDEENMEDVNLLDDEFADSDVIYLSEGRGLTRVAVVFAALEDPDDPNNTEWAHITVSALNLITGKGIIQEIDADELYTLMNKVSYDEF